MAGRSCGMGELVALDIFNLNRLIDKSARPGKQDEYRPEVVSTDSVNKKVKKRGRPLCPVVSNGFLFFL